jgi:hypothetical protein
LTSIDQAPASGPALQAAAAQLLALSDERDRQLAARLAACRQGYAAGAAGQFSAGYAAAIADVKAADHAIVGAIRRFGRPQPDPASFPAGEAWLAAVLRHGCTEYAGAGRPRVPVSAEDITRVWGEQTPGWRKQQGAGQ